MAKVATRTRTVKDPNPSWTGHETWDKTEFYRKRMWAMDYYRMETNPKDLKPEVIKWMSANGFTPADVKKFKKMKDWRCNATMGAIASCLLRGMPAVRADFNEGRDTAEWLKAAIYKAMAEGADDVDEEEVAEAAKTAKANVYVPSIQERLRDAAGAMTDELEEAIDSYMKDPDAFNPKEFNVARLLRGKGAKAAHARLIKTFYERPLSEYNELLGKEPDEQLLEGYSSYSKKNQKKMQEFLASIVSACDTIIGEAKIMKAPRKKKVKPAEDLVKKVKFKMTDDSLQVTSVPPATMIGASAMVFYNTKTRKIGIYYAQNIDTTGAARVGSGLSAKGTTVVQFNEATSLQKTLRKPAEQLKKFKDCNTLRKFENFFEKEVKTTAIKCNGRLNEDIVLLKVFK
jgi:AcrR family transcriptional regulator